MSMDVSHTFTRSEINECEHLFRKTIENHFGEIWSPKSDAQYKGKYWDARSMIPVRANGLWYLVEGLKHVDAKRVFGRIEVRETGTVVRFIGFYDFENPSDEKLIIVPQYGERS